MFVSCASMEVVLFSAIVGELRFKLLLTRFVAFQKIEIGDFSFNMWQRMSKGLSPSLC